MILPFNKGKIKYNDQLLELEQSVQWEWNSFPLNLYYLKRFKTLYWKHLLSIENIYFLHTI